MISATWANAEKTLIREGDSFVPADPANADYARLLAAEIEIAPYAAPATTVDDYMIAVQREVDAIARKKNYTDGVSLASYVASTNTQWVAEATAFIAWRDQVWASVYATMAAVQSGQQAQPTIEALITGLPPISWPQ